MQVPGMCFMPLGLIGSTIRHCCHIAILLLTLVTISFTKGKFYNLKVERKLYHSTYIHIYAFKPVGAYNRSLVYNC